MTLKTSFVILSDLRLFLGMRGDVAIALNYRLDAVKHVLATVQEADVELGPP